MKMNELFAPKAFYYEQFWFEYWIFDNFFMFESDKLFFE